MIACTVSELRNLLASLPQEATLHTVDPPFDGVRLVEGNGKYLVAGLTPYAEWATTQMKAKNVKAD